MSQVAQTFIKQGYFDPFRVSKLLYHGDTLNNVTHFLVILQKNVLFTVITNLKFTLSICLIHILAQSL